MIETKKFKVGKEEKTIKAFCSSTDNESLIATIEVLSDPDLMRGIKEALEEESRGEKGTSLEDFKKELGMKN